MDHSLETREHYRYVYDRLLRLSSDVGEVKARLVVVESDLRRSTHSPAALLDHRQTAEHAVRAYEILAHLAPLVWRGILWLLPRVVLFGGFLQGLWQALARTIAL